MTVSVNRYSTGAILLHWVIAAMMVFQFVLGWATEGPNSPQKFAIFQLHKSIGISILLLTLVRIGWRLTHRPPALSSELKRWERLLARFVHGGFYLLLLALPLTGWLLVSTSKIKVPTLLFGVIPWPHIPVPDMLRSPLHEVGEAHGLFADIALVLIALHVLGALKHHFFDRDAELARMIPGVKVGARFDARLLLIFISVGVLAAAANAYPWGTVRPPASARAVAPPKEPLTSASMQPGPSEPPLQMMPEPPIETKAAPETPIPKTAEKVAPVPVSDIWAVERAGSSLGFATTWSGMAVNGKFARWNADISFNPDRLAAASVAVTIDVASVSATDGQVSGALQTSDWFDVAAHPKATFVAKTISKSGAKRYIANGTLTLRGVSKPLSLPFTLTIKDNRATMTGSAQIDRLAFGVGQGEWAATGDVPASVTVTVRVAATRK
ncbi:MAG: YceI family protein [Sphingomonadaceae bacterium]